MLFFLKEHRFACKLQHATERCRRCSVAMCRLTNFWTVFTMLKLQISAYPQMAGSCNGVFGKHLPNSVSGDGGYRIGITIGSILADGTQSANVSIYHTGFTLNTSTTPSQPAKGDGYYYGLLLRSFDPNTGSLKGTFQTPLPVNTMLYQGCSSPSSAVSHNLANTAFVTTNPTLVFQFSWPANTDIAFQAFIVETTSVFYQVEHTVVHQARRSPSSACLAISSAPPHTHITASVQAGGGYAQGDAPKVNAGIDCRPRWSAAPIIIGFCPVIILVPPPLPCSASTSRARTGARGAATPRFAVPYARSRHRTGSVVRCAARAGAPLTRTYTRLTKPQHRISPFATGAGQLGAARVRRGQHAALHPAPRLQAAASAQRRPPPAPRPGPATRPGPPPAPDTAGQG